MNVKATYIETGNVIQETPAPIPWHAWVHFETNSDTMLGLKPFAELQHSKIVMPNIWLKFININITQIA